MIRERSLKSIKKSIRLLILRTFYKSLIPFQLFLHEPGDFISDWIRNNNRYYEYDMLHFMQTNFDCSRFVDIGANIGNHSHYFKSLGYKGWSFEPSHKNFMKLTSNVSGEAFECFNVALSNVAGTDTLVTFDSALGNNYIQSTFGGAFNDWGSGISTETVNVRTLDSFEIDNPTLIKIDVEGSELKVLEGAKETLIKFSPVLVIEIHEDQTLDNANFPYRRKDILEFLTGIGYELTCSFNETNHFFQKPSKPSEESF